MKIISRFDVFLIVFFILATGAYLWVLTLAPIMILVVFLLGLLIAVKNHEVNLHQDFHVHDLEKLIALSLNHFKKSERRD
jgi:hypothetical protein